MKFKNGLLIAIIALIVIGVVGLTLYKGKILDKITTNDKLIFTAYQPSNKKANLKWPDEKDEVLYKDSIITTDVKEVEYTFYDKIKSIIGKIYIDNNNLLHITDDNDYRDKVTSTVKFKTMKTRESRDMYDSIYVYLISTDNKLYVLILKSNNIYEYQISEITTKRQVLNFTNLSYDNDMYPSGNTLFVLENDGNIYDIFSGNRYMENVKFIFDTIAVYNDNTISNIYGNMFENKDGKNYKIKYVFDTSASNELIGEDAIIIITEDNELIVINEYKKFSVANLKVKSVKFDKNMPFISGKIVLELENGKEIKLNGSCSLYYCTNEFDMSEHEIEFDNETDIE